MQKQIFDYIINNLASLITVILGLVALILAQFNIIPKDKIGDTTLALVIALATSQLVDHARKLEKIEKSIEDGFHQAETKFLDAVAINHQLYNDDMLRSIVQNIVRNYFHIKNSHLNAVYDEQLKLILETCITKLDELAEGRISVQDEDERTKLIIKILQQSSTKSLKAVAYTGRWYGQLSAKWLEENRLATKRGVVIERILIVPDISSNDLKIIIQNQLEAGIKLYIALEISVPDNLRKHFGMFDNAIVTINSFNRKGDNVGGIISVRSWDIQQIQQNWDRLKLYTREIHNIEELPSVIKFLTNHLTVSDSPEK